MKRYRDPTPALPRRDPELPLIERILCGIVLVLLVLGAIWVSVTVGP